MAARIPHLEGIKSEELAAYLDRHGIYNLYHDLVTALIHDRPEDPLQHLVETLRKPREPRVLLVAPQTRPFIDFAQQLAQRLHVTPVSLSDMAAAAIQKGTSLGHQLAMHQQRDGTLPPHLALKLLDGALAPLNGWVVHDTVGTRPFAQALQRQWTSVGQNLLIVVVRRSLADPLPPATAFVADFPYVAYVTLEDEAPLDAVVRLTRLQPIRGPARRAGVVICEEDEDAFQVGQIFEQGGYVHVSVRNILLELRSQTSESSLLAYLDHEKALPAETAKTLVLARLQKPDCLARGWFLTLDPVHVAVVRDTPELSGTSTLWVATHAPSAAVLAGLGADWIPRSRRGLDVNHDLDTPAITAKAVAERVMGALALCPVPQGV